MFQIKQGLNVGVFNMIIGINESKHYIKTYVKMIMFGNLLNVTARLENI